MKYITDKNQNGFTLIEVLITLVIFAFGILGMNAMQISAIKGNSKGRQVSEAATVAADYIEAFLMMDYSDSDLNDDDGDGTNQDADSDGTDDDGGNFGLDDLTNPDGADDRNGDGVNDIFWNVAIDHPLPNTKTIKIFVDQPSGGAAVELEYVKAEGI